MKPVRGLYAPVASKPRSATPRRSRVRRGSPAARDRAARLSSPSSTRCTSTPPCGGIVVMLPITSHLSRFAGERVQPAFGLAAAAPPPSALGLARRGGPGARPAADARVALVEQGVVWHGVLPDVAPHVGPAPPGEREDFDDGVAVDLVVLDRLRGPTGGGLVLPHGADPGVVCDDGALQGLDLAKKTAAVRIGLIQGTRIGERRELHQIEPVALGEAPLEFVGLAEVEPGVQENYRHGAVNPADQVRQDHPATAEAHREGNLGGEGLYRPGERRRGIRPGQHGGALAYLEGAKHPIRSLGSPARPGDRLPSPRSWRRLHAPCRPPAPARAALRRDPRPL